MVRLGTDTRSSRECTFRASSGIRCEPPLPVTVLSDAAADHLPHGYTNFTRRLPTDRNVVEVFDEPRAIAWKPGTESPETGELSVGGWIWRYDLEATDPSRTTLTLTYDWSAVPTQVREYLEFPPFGQDHLDNSLQHLSDLVA